MSVSHVTYNRLFIWILCVIFLFSAMLPGAALAENINKESDEENAFDPLVFDDAGTAPKEVAAVYGDISPELRLEAFPVSTGRTGKLDQWKFTLYGTDHLLSLMKEKLSEKDTPYDFRYTMEVFGNTDFAFVGNVSYGEYKEDIAPHVTHFNMVLEVGEYRYSQGTTLHCKRSTANQLSWLAEIPRSAHFDIGKTTGYQFSIYSAENRLHKLVYDFDPAISSFTALYTPTRRGGALKIDMPTERDMEITIIDPQIPDSYKNSLEKKGNITPYWKLVLELNSMAWLELTLDGKNGEPMDDMHCSCKCFERKYLGKGQFTPKNKATKTAIDCTYSINGEQIHLTLRLPEKYSISFDDVERILLDMSNGLMIRTTKYKLF